jgi:16S rRNA (cytosine1402-N4)-methyltransferase
MKMSLYHVPALLKESIEGLNIKPDGIYVDVTYGGGGHSTEILKHLNKGRLIAFDQDEDAFKNRINDKRFMLIHSNYRYIKNYLKYFGILKVDGIIADLGISFHQVDEIERGFSFRADADIDMRMNKKGKITSADILNDYDEKELIRIVRDYGELNNAYQIAKVIIENRNVEKFQKTNQLVHVLSKFAPKNAENKFFAKIFQALRIEVNNEMESLKDLLKAGELLLSKGGRLVIISYHSLEDRLVKNFIRSGNFGGEIEKDIYGNFETALNQLVKKPIVPSEKEIKENPRSRSAKLRIAEKI